jgi:hypothetical protein
MLRSAPKACLCEQTGSQPDTSYLRPSSTMGNLTVPPHTVNTSQTKKSVSASEDQFLWHQAACDLLAARLACPYFPVANMLYQPSTT